MTVPCCHFLCGASACKFVVIWSDDDAESDKNVQCVVFC